MLVSWYGKYALHSATSTFLLTISPPSAWYVSCSCSGDSCSKCSSICDHCDDTFCDKCSDGGLYQCKGDGCSKAQCRCCAEGDEAGIHFCTDCDRSFCPNCLAKDFKNNRNHYQDCSICLMAVASALLKENGRLSDLNNKLRTGRA